MTTYTYSAFIKTDDDLAEKLPGVDLILYPLGWARIAVSFEADDPEKGLIKLHEDMPGLSNYTVHKPQVEQGQVIIPLGESK